LQVFISWSGRLAERVAVALRDWLPTMIQAIRPYVSSEDIDKGTRWSAELFARLEQSAFGILCITPENVRAPWLNFEAGALSNSLTGVRVSPFLVGVGKSDLVGPMTQFQATAYERDDVLRLAKSLNSCLDAPLEPRVLEQTFSVMWPRLESLLDAVAAKARSGSPTGVVAGRSDREILDELLDGVRSLLRSPPRQETAVTSSAPPMPDHLLPSVVADLAETWLGALGDLSLPENERLLACREWLTVASAPVLYIIRRQGGREVAAEFERRVEAVYRRITTAAPGEFRYVPESDWGRFLGRT
jgi:hypothetical protein